MCTICIQIAFEWQLKFIKHLNFISVIIYRYREKFTKLIFTCPKFIFI